jgi:syntaxin 16
MKLFHIALYLRSPLPPFVVTQLQEAHAARLRISFGDDESERERRIEDATANVNRLLKGAESKIKKIAMMGGDDTLSQPEKIVRLNVMRHLGNELNSISKGYRGTQKEYMEKLKAQQHVGNDFFQEVDDGDRPGTFEDALDRGLTEEQVMALREIEERADEREKEIIHLAQSINDMASLFQELNVLVIEQGTILDRIDYNVEQTLVKVQEGNVELRKADDYSKKTPTLKCILVLMLILTVEIIILIWKHS